MTGAIDILCYFFSHEAIQKYWYDCEELYRVVLWWQMQDRVQGRSLDEFVALLDEAGVEKVLIPATKMMSYKTKKMLWDISPDEVLAVVQSKPDRFVGMAGFNPYSGMAGVQEVEHAVRTLGFRGVHLHTYGFGLELDHRKYYPLYAKCVELGVPVVMQVGHSAEHMPSALGRPILVDTIALDFPDLNIVGAHTGWPWTDEMIALAWKHENVYIGIDAHHPRYLDPSLLRFMKSRGRTKVLWGTNYPVVAHASANYMREHLGLSPEVQDLILRENARKLFGL
ncbi:MAG: amidohydrolase [Candidatus Tectomicrobia bacterium]|nr:amidohydrolase [Candidatus Tectomicrobia bacterium]